MTVEASRVRATTSAGATARRKFINASCASCSRRPRSRSCRSSACSATCSRRACPRSTSAFFTELPKPVGEAGGGMANARLGTADPRSARLGSSGSRGGSAPRSSCPSTAASAAPRSVSASDILASIPSIVIGPLRLRRRRAADEALLGVRGRPGARHPHGAHRRPQRRRAASSSCRRISAKPAWLWAAALEGDPADRAAREPERHRHRRDPRRRARGRRDGAAAFHRAQQPLFGRSLDQPIASLPVQIYTYAITRLTIGIGRPGPARWCSWFWCLS